MQAARPRCGPVWASSPDLHPPSPRSAAQAVQAAASTSTTALPERLHAMVGRFSVPGMSEKERLRVLLEVAAGLQPLPEDARTAQNRVMGCTAMVWVLASVDEHGRMQFAGWSDSEVSRGLLAVLAGGLSGCTPEEVQEVRSCIRLHTLVGNSEELMKGGGGGRWGRTAMHKRQAAWGQAECRLTGGQGRSKCAGRFRLRAALRLPC